MAIIATKNSIGTSMPIEVSKGGTGANTLTFGGVLLGSGTGAITPLAAAATGSTLMGNTGADPSFTGSPSFSGTVTAGTGLSVTTGNAAVVAGNITLPVTNAAGTEGVITVAGTRWIHNFGTQSTYVGVNSGNTTLTTATAINNTCVGAGTGSAITSGNRSVAVGNSALGAMTTGTRNTAVGHSSMSNCTTSGYNTALGQSTLQQLGTGSYNFGAGYAGGFGLTLTDSSNICIMNQGTAGDNNTLRIGAQGAGDGQINKSFIAGIYNTTPVAAAAQAVTVTTTGQLSASNNLVLPNQCAFLAYLSVTDENVTGDTTQFIIGSGNSLTEVFDQGNNLNAASGVFTAPITARYAFYTSVILGSITIGDRAIIRLVTSNRTYASCSISPKDVETSSGYVGLPSSFLVDMDAGDTCSLQIYSSGEAGRTQDVFGTGAPQTFFSGYLVC